MEIKLADPEENREDPLYKTLCNQMAAGHGDLRHDANDEELMELYITAQSRITSLLKFRALGTYASVMLKCMLINERRVLVRPIFRGKIHYIMVVLSPLWFTTILYNCATPAAWIGGVVACFAIFYNALASFLLHHSTSECPRVTEILRRMDHCGIFLSISLSCFTMNTVVADGWLAIVYSASMFILAALGIVSIFFKLLDVHPMARSGVYVVVGLCHLMIVPQAIKTLYLSEGICLAGLAASYIIGAFFYGSRLTCSKSQKFYGFHEIFHFHCFIAAIFTVAFNYLVITNHQYDGMYEAY